MACVWLKLQNPIQHEGFTNTFFCNVCEHVDFANDIAVCSIDRVVRCCFVIRVCVDNFILCHQRLSVAVVKRDDLLFVGCAALGAKLL